jgi:glycosyltransferase involved in cell wall biosynthesis
MVKLYHESHCLVYPTMGEGFGMIPFEAICTGMPTIVTNATGCKDFAQYSIPLDADFISADWNTNAYGEDTGSWASPDIEQLTQLMTTVVDEYDEFKKYTIKSAKTLHLENSWDSIADKMIKRFEFIENIL